MTSERCALGLRVMAAGKDYFTDKAPLTTLEQLEEREYRAASSIPAASRNPGSYKRHPISIQSAVFVTVSLAELLPVLPSVLSIVWILFRSTSTHFFITQLLYCDF